MHTTTTEGGLRMEERPLTGFPTPRSATKSFDELDLNRAVRAYRFFYPTVSAAAIVRGHASVGLVDNQVFGLLETQPRHVGFTYNADTPYGPMGLDLRSGPMVVELPPGPLICMAIDLNQRWVADMGIPGPDAGRGGKHLILPPGYRGEVPSGYFVSRSTTYGVIGGVRALPVEGDVSGALDRIRKVTTRPLAPSAGWSEPRWIDLSDRAYDTTPVAWEDNLEFWKALHGVIDSEPLFEGYRDSYGDLVALGIAKGKPFAPDGRMKRVLQEAARLGKAQMRAQSFADRRPDRVVWPDRQWEWAALRFENGDFMADTHVDLEAREKWFYQAIGASPAMFRRQAGSGSLYWLGTRDRSGEYLDGGKSYVLSVPRPVPCTLFWSVTVYDAATRSQIQTDQGRAALRSLFELRGAEGSGTVALHFAPQPLAGREGRWIKTIPGRGWFVYFRIYGPQAGAFDGSWKLPDFTLA